MRPATSARFNIEQARKQAKELLRSFRAREEGAAMRFRVAIRQLGALDDDEVLDSKIALRDAQRVIAVEHGFPSWEDLVNRVERGVTPQHTAEQVADFFAAVRRLDAAAVRRALDEAPSLVDALMVDTDYMLEGEAFRRALLRNPHPVSHDTRTALHLVATGFFGKTTPELLEVARALIERGADVNRVGWDGNNDHCAPITLAAWEGGVEMLRLLLEAGADASGAHGAEALSTAASHNQIDRYNLLEEYGAPVDAFSLVDAGLIERLSDLLKSDPALLSLRDRRGYTLLQAAAARADRWLGDHGPPSGRALARAVMAAGTQPDAFSASALNDVDLLVAILAADASLADARLEDGASPLCFAARSGSLEAAALLLEAGADANVSFGPRKKTPLNAAAIVDDAPLCGLLLEHGATPSDKDVSAACWRNRDPECVRLLLEHGGDARAKTDGFGSINWAAWAGQPLAVRALLEHGADPNERAGDWAGAVPLHFAASARNATPERVHDAINTLLDAGADPAARDANGLTPLDMAVERGDEAAAEALRARAAVTGASEADRAQPTPDAAAVQLFHKNWFLRNEEPQQLTPVEEQVIAAALGERPSRWRGAPDLDRLGRLVAENPDALDRIGERLLTVAIGMKGCGPAVAFLLAKGAPLNIDPKSYNVLHEAAWGGMTDTLRAVFESGVADATCVSVKKPHVGWPDNLSLMYWAAVGGYVDCAELLIKWGVGVHHELRIKGNGERGSTSLQEALAPSHWGDDAGRAAGRREVARLLIEDGADYDVYSACALDDTARLQALVEEDAGVVSASEDFGMTPLHWAARAGAMRCARALLTMGASPNAINKNRRAPLHMAAEQDQVEMIRLLAGRGADLDAQDRKGRSPLHRATYEGRAAAAEALLAMGADADIRAKNGKTPFEIARKEARYLKQRTTTR